MVASARCSSSPSPSPSPMAIASVYLTCKHPSNQSYSPYIFKCASTRALPIPREHCRPSPSVIIVAALAASALGIIAVSDDPSYVTSYLSRKLLMKWTFIPHIFRRVCALPTLVHSSVGQPRYLISSLAAGGSPRCQSVVILILLQHRPRTLIGLQYRRSEFISASRLVNIPVGAFGKDGSRESSYPIPIWSYSAMIFVAMLGHHLSVGVSTVCHDAVW